MIDKIILFSIKNKAIVGLMTLAIIIGGIYSMTKVPLDAMPDITNNQVLVITTAPNLGTEDIERFVTYQVELAVANLPDVVEIRSISRFGLSVVTIVFEESAGTFLPRQLVSEALDEVKNKIPEGFGEPYMAPISTGLGEIYQYTLEIQPGYDSLYDDMQLRTIQDWIVKRQMAMLPGIVEVNSFGGYGKQYEVAVNPDKLQSMGISITDIFDALEKNNENTGGAYIEKNHQANFIRGEGLMRSIDDIRNTPVTNINGHPVFIRDVAEVDYGNFQRYGAFTRNGKGEAVGGIIMMLKGENSNDIIKAVKKRMSLIQKSLPEGVVIKPFLDRSKLIKSTTTTVSENLLIGALIVIFILVLFLGNLRGGLIVASTIPLALLFAFIMMNVFGVWANLMSLGALDFGILVDGAVIIIESMIFYLNKNEFTGTIPSAKVRDRIAYNSAGKMMNSAFFGQLIILIVFIPILTLQGVEGKMFKPMALTFGFAITGVVILCLTYIPMMAALFIKPPKTNKKTIGDKIITSIENSYKPVIRFALKRKTAVLGSAVFLVITGILLFSRMGAEFIPKLDEGDFAFQALLRPGTALSDVTDATTHLEKIVMDNFPDEVESIQSRIGVADVPMDPMPMDIADIFVIVKPKENWTKAKTKQELISKVKKAVSVLPGINFEFTQPIEMRFNELLTGVREDIAIKLYGDNLNTLSAKAKEISNLISDVEGIESIKVEATRGLPQITINYDRNRLGYYNMNINDINKAIETAFGGGIAGRIYEGEKMFDLVVRLDRNHRKNIDDIRNLFITTPDGTQIPLKAVADINYKSGPMQISRDNTNRRIYVGINTGDRDIKSIVNDIKSILDKQLSLPAGYYIRYGGTFENLESATARLSMVVPLTLSLIFILVFFAVKSLKQTLMIYAAIPFAAVGGVISLYLRDMPFSISAGVGFIVLFGVAVLNGLVLINGFNEMNKKGNISLTDIIITGSVRRIRPILLTASTDIVGFLPMAISTSAGAEVQRPLATVVIGGMLTSTLLTLIVLPILYNIIEKPKKIRIPKVATTTIILLTFIFLIPWKSHGQGTTLTLQQAITIATENHPAVMKADLEAEKQSTLKSTAYNLGTTTLFTGKEENISNITGVYNKVGLSQNDIDIFGIAPKLKFSESMAAKTDINRRITSLSLIRDLKTAWYKAVYEKQQWLLLQSLDTLYSKFTKAAELRYKTRETSKLEYMSAMSKYNELKVRLKTAESNYSAALRMIERFLPGIILTDIAGDNEISDKSYQQYDSLYASPVLEYYKSDIDIAESQWKKEKANLYPKINLGYKWQEVDGAAGYYGWEAGITMPLLFFEQSAKNKAANIDYKIAMQQYSQKKLELSSQYNFLINRYQSLFETIEYYKNTALPLADEQIRASLLAYKLGSIDYVQFIQNTETAVKTKQSFLKQELEIRIIEAKLSFIKGN